MNWEYLSLPSRVTKAAVSLFPAAGTQCKEVTVAFLSGKTRAAVA
jgi:hypothetical protein